MSNISSFISNFLASFNKFQVDHQPLLTELVRECAQATSHQDAVLSEFLDDYATTLKDRLGAKGANTVADDEAEAAIDAVDARITDHVSNGSLHNRIAAVLWIAGPVAGADLLRKQLASAIEVTKPTALKPTVRLTFDVTYDLQGEPLQDLVNRLQAMCQRAIEEGCITGSSLAEVEDYKIRTEILAEPIAEDAVAQFMAQRIESGDLSAEDLPLRLARYGLMDSNAFVEEISERMSAGT